MNPKIIPTLPSLEDLSFIGAITPPPNTRLPKISNEPSPWRNLDSNANNPLPGQKSYYCAYPTDNQLTEESVDLADHQISQEHQKAEPESNIASLQANASKLHDQIQEKLTQLGNLPNSQREPYLQKAHQEVQKALEEFAKTPPNLEILKLRLQAASWFYQAATGDSINPQDHRLICFLGLARVNQRAAIEMEKPQPGKQIMEAVKRACSCYQKALNVTNLEQARRFRLAGSSLQNAINPNLTVEIRTTAFKAAKLYEEAANTIETNKTYSEYALCAACAFEGIVREKAKAAPCQEALQYFFQAKDLSTQAMEKLERDLPRAAFLGEAANKSFFLAQEYHNSSNEGRKPPEEVTRSLLHEIGNLQQIIENLPE